MSRGSSLRHRSHSVTDLRRKHRRLARVDFAGPAEGDLNFLMATEIVEDDAPSDDLSGLLMVVLHWDNLTQQPHVPQPHRQLGDVTDVNR